VSADAAMRPLDGAGEGLQPWAAFVASRWLTFLCISAILVLCAWLFPRWAIPPNDPWEWREPRDPYALQTQAWIGGHTYLGLVPDPHLAELANPYDGSQNRPYRVLDLSYYRGRYYLYFGAGPVVMLLLPWRLITGEYLAVGAAVAYFALATVVLATGLLVSCWRRYFGGVPGAAIVIGVGILAFGNLLIRILDQANFYEVAQTGAYFAQMGALVASYAALSSRTGRARAWLAAASLFCGLAIASRPSFILGAALLIPVAWAVASPWRPGRWPRLAGAALAAAVPLGLVIGGLMAYNAARFGSALEFGNRYALGELDSTKPRMLSLAYLPAKMAFLTGPVHWVHYFPFVATTMEPVGILTGLPFLILCAGILAARARRPATPADRSAAFLLSAALATLGVMAFLALFYVDDNYSNWIRYEVDFLVPMSLVAVLGWLVLLSRCRALMRRLTFSAGALLALFTLVVSVAFSAKDYPYPERLVSLAADFNGPIFAWDRIRGTRYGALSMQVRLPADAMGLNLPLLTTGNNSGDVLFVRLVDDSHAVFGYFHAGAGGPVSDPVPLETTRPHEISIFEGSFLPPDFHPMFEGWSRPAMDHARHALRVRLDGADVLSQDVDFYETSPGGLGIGVCPVLGADVAQPAFTGRIESTSRAAFEASDAGSRLPNAERGITMEIRFPRIPIGSIEPLLSTGLGDTGNLLTVAYFPGSQVQLTLKQTGAPDVTTPLVDGSPEQVHRVSIRLGSLSAPNNGAGGADPRLVLAYDGRTLVDILRPTHPSDPMRVQFGLNTAFYYPPCKDMFSGTILSVAPWTAVGDAPPKS
jgi:hypothetical protein